MIGGSHFSVRRRIVRKWNVVLGNGKFLERSTTGDWSGGWPIERCRRETALNSSSIGAASMTTTVGIMMPPLSRPSRACGSYRVMSMTHSD